MDINTPITTAARRITRALNATPAEVTLSFDADGHQVDAHPTGMWYADPAEAPDYVVKSPGARNRPDKVTHRAIQDQLDAHAFAAAHTSPGSHHADLIEEYLMDLGIQRDLHRHGVSA